MNKYIIILLISIFIASCSQIILKRSANKKYDKLIYEYMNIKVIIGYSLMVLSTIITIISLKGLQYKYVPVMESFGYIFVLILSYIFLNEKITLRKIVGNIIIIIGIVIFSI